METLSLKKRPGRPPKIKPVDKTETTSMFVRCSVFIPGETPFEVKYEVPDFRGKSYGPTRTPEGIKQFLYEALVAKYGNRVI